MQFIVEHQAAFAAGLEALKVRMDKMAEQHSSVKADHEARIQETEKNINRLIEAQWNTERNVARVAESLDRLTARVDTLAEKVDILVTTVDSIVRRPN